MELLYESIRILREDYLFNGYIHIKAIPGADLNLIEATGRLVDRMSVNIELPSSKSLKLLAPQKEKEAILKPMGFISSKIIQKQEERSLTKKAPDFVPAGQSTQLIIGASPEHDLSILRLSEKLYQSYKLKRVYYSAYVPVSSQNPNLPAIKNPPLLREHRLYQADWLLRFYGFSSDELLDEKTPDFDINLDPKANWALNHLELFPVEINRADYEMLLRVPGIGVRSAKKIISARRVKSLNHDDLKKLGIVLKRARFFITCNGKYSGGIDMNDTLIRHALTDKANRFDATTTWEQLSLFSLIDNMPTVNDKIMSITGEM
jgi:putative DNA modification/repair radical SAM protein